MVDVRILGDADLDDAVAVLAHGIQEIPLYRWVLGDHVGDLGKREWLASVLLRPPLSAGCVAGAEIDGRLVGVLAWQVHGGDAPSTAPVLTREHLEPAKQTPDLLVRLRDLWTSPPLQSPVDDGVEVIVAAIAPEARGSTTLIDLVAGIEEYCQERNLPAFLWTGTRRVRDWFEVWWSGSEFAAIEWNGMTLYGLVSERPLTRRAD